MSGTRGSVCQVFYTSNGIDSIDDSLLIYTGTIRRFSQTFDSLKLELEDFTQQVLSAKVPSTLIPEDFVQYDEKMFNKPYPMVYGNIDATPLVYNKLGRLEIDKPAQKVYGFWNFGTTIDYQNETIDEKPVLVIQLKYNLGNPVINTIERVSKPGRRIFSSAESLPKINNGLGIAIVSTPKGVMTDIDARKQKIGGEIICKVF